MKNNDINQLIERLQGFDGDALGDEMTDGLEEWCRKRRQRAVTVKQVTALVLLLLTTTAVAMTVVPMMRPSKPVEETEPVATTGPQPSPTPSVQSECVVVKAVPAEAVEYHYTGVAEDGYSVAYGHDTRTLTYTRYSGQRLIHSVMPGDLSALFPADTVCAALPDNPLAEPHSEAPRPASAPVSCDFQSVSIGGDALYYTIIDSLLRTVSVRGDVAEWMGQRICYGDTLVLPTAVEHNGVVYTVASVADSAFTGHGELRTVVLPSTIGKVGDMAFAGCIGIEQLVVLTSMPPEAASASFDHTNAQLMLTVPCGSRKAFEDDVEWIYFRNVSEDCETFSDPRRPHIRVIRR